VIKERVGALQGTDEIIYIYLKQLVELVEAVRELQVRPFVWVL
jgi:hypothetical protein